MYNILKSLGFKYRRPKDGRKFLLERSDIVAARLKFLRTTYNIRSSDDSRPVFYLDETWLIKITAGRLYGNTHQEGGGDSRYLLAKLECLSFAMQAHQNGFYTGK